MCDAFKRESSTLLPEQAFMLCHDLSQNGIFNMTMEECQGTVAAGLVPALKDVLVANCPDECAAPCKLIASEGDFTSVCKSFADDPQKVDACMSVMAGATGKIGSTLASRLVPCDGCLHCPCTPSDKITDLIAR